MTLDPNKFSSDFVNVKEIGCLTLDFIGSDKLKELFTTAEYGTMWNGNKLKAVEKRYYKRTQSGFGYKWIIEKIDGVEVN